MSNVQFPMSNEGMFDIYLQELIEWNKKFNLTAVKTPDEIRSRHFEDSLSVLEAVDLQDQVVADIGPGAGFPSLPLKIVRPGISLTLIEATRKKAEFLKHIVSKLNLQNVEVVWGRAEQVSKDPRYSNVFDVVLARAVAKLPVLIGYAFPLLDQRGVLIAQKQDDVSDEIKDSKPVLQKLGGKIKEIKKVKVSDITRSLVIVEKF